MTDPDYFLTGSFLHRPIQILSSPADPFLTGYPDPFFLKTNNLDHFFTGSFLHRPIQILSSSADPRIKLRRRRSFLHRPIHEPSSATQILSSPADRRTKLWWPTSFLHRRPISLCWFVCVGLFVCGCVSVLIYLCGCICVHLRKTRWELRLLCTEKREKNWCERKLIK